MFIKLPVSELSVAEIAVPNLPLPELPVSELPVPFLPVSELPGVGDDSLAIFLPDHEVGQVALPPPLGYLLDCNLNTENTGIGSRNSSDTLS